MKPIVELSPREGAVIIRCSVVMFAVQNYNIWQKTCPECSRMKWRRVHTVLTAPTGKPVCCGDLTEFTLFWTVKGLKRKQGLSQEAFIQVTRGISRRSLYEVSAKWISHFGPASYFYHIDGFRRNLVYVNKNCLMNFILVIVARLTFYIHVAHHTE